MNTMTATDIKQAVEILRAGGILIFPTETSYGLGCDATNREAVEKIFALKGRPADKALPILVRDVDQAMRFVEFGERARELAQKYWPGPLNLILPVLEPLATSSADNFQSVRVSGQPVAQELVGLFGQPIVATSANLSGKPSLYDVSKLEEAFGDRLSFIDGVIDVGPLPVAPASTTAKVTGEDVQILRQGSVVI
jgi:L-threonylcarbamoyladenylate synthase